MKPLSLLFPLLAASVVALAAPNSRSPDHDYDIPQPGTYGLPVIKPAADGALLDSSGRPIQLANLTQGRVTVLSFIYTRCAAARACPYATGVLLQLHRASASDPELAGNLRLVSLSFDPANDTPERMAGYAGIASQHPGGAPWHFVTSRSQRELQPVLAAYGQAVDRKPNPADPTGPLNHTLRVFLIDRSGQIRNVYSADTLDPRLVLADVRTLMKEPIAITPAEAAHRAGQTCTVAFRVRSTARVTNITEKANPIPVEVLLMDSTNGHPTATPVDLAGILVRIPHLALQSFGAQTLDELARRYEGRNVTVTGQVTADEVASDVDRAHAKPRTARITITTPDQIRIGDQR